MIAGDQKLYCVSSFAYLGVFLFVVFLYDTIKFNLISVLVSTHDFYLSTYFPLHPTRAGRMCGTQLLAGLKPRDTQESLSLKCFSQDCICNTPHSERNQGKPRANYFLFWQGKMKLIDLTIAVYSSVILRRFKNFTFQSTNQFLSICFITVHSSLFP